MFPVGKKNPGVSKWLKKQWKKKSYRKKQIERTRRMGLANRGISNEKNSRHLIGRKQSFLHRKRKSRSMKKLWKNLLYKNMRISSSTYRIAESQKSPNKIEKTILKVLKKNKIRSRWVGNRKLIIGGKIPDIILVGTKKLIEVNGLLYHADPRRFDPNDIIPKLRKPAKQIWKSDKEKRKIFKKMGYECLVVWELDIKKNFKRVERRLIKYAEK